MRKLFFGKLRLLWLVIVIAVILLTSVMMLKPKYLCVSKVENISIECGRLLGEPLIVAKNLKELIIVNEIQSEMLVGGTFGATYTYELIDGSVRMNIQIPETLFGDKMLNDKISIGILNALDSHINSTEDLELEKNRVRKNIADWSGKEFVKVSIK